MFSPKSNNHYDQLKLAREVETILDKRVSYVEVSIESCEHCCTPLELTDTHKICNNCGFQAEQLVIENNYDFEFSTVSLKLSHKDSNYNSMLSSINKKFTDLNQSGLIPEHIIRNMAYRYISICKTIRSADKSIETKKRCSSIKWALLWDEMGASTNTFMTKDELIDYLGITVREFMKSYAKLLEYHRNGMADIKMIPKKQSLPLLIKRYLDVLNIDIDIIDAIIMIINVCNNVRETIEFRTCENKTRYASVVWVVLSQIGISITPETMIDKIGVSKSTYERYVDFIYQNRKIVNPWLVMNKVRPIPRSFILKKQGRRRRVLSPIESGNPFIWITKTK